MEARRPESAHKPLPCGVSVSAATWLIRATYSSARHKSLLCYPALALRRHNDRRGQVRDAVSPGRRRKVVGDDLHRHVVGVDRGGHRRLTENFGLHAFAVDARRAAEIDQHEPVGLAGQTLGAFESRLPADRPAVTYPPKVAVIRRLQRTAGQVSYSFYPSLHTRCQRNVPIRPIVIGNDCGRESWKTVPFVSELLVVPADLGEDPIPSTRVTASAAAKTADCFTCQDKNDNV